MRWARDAPARPPSSIIPVPLQHAGSHRARFPYSLEGKLSRSRTHERRVGACLARSGGRRRPRSGPRDGARSRREPPVSRARPCYVRAVTIAETRPTWRLLRRVPGGHLIEREDAARGAAGRTGQLPPPSRPFAVRAPSRRRVPCTCAESFARARRTSGSARRAPSVPGRDGRAEDRRGACGGRPRGGRRACPPLLLVRHARASRATWSGVRASAALPAESTSSCARRSAS